MRLPIEWIKEYAPVEADADALAQTLTMAGLEVEETEESVIGPVLNITVTPNRGDCLSVVGVAREVAAACGVQLVEVPYSASLDEGHTADLTSVTLDAPDLCPRYAARIVRNVRSRPSPAWLQARLIAAGMRPVGGVVDVTNYVMLETGQPLHAFDYERLREGRIVVRSARAGEAIKTLDGTERSLTADMLAICDAGSPVAVAGVMGGADSEVTGSTKTILLESAHFDALSVRRTSRQLNLKTEASYRFERVVDPAGVVAAADRACSLIQTLGLGEVVTGVIDQYPHPIPLRTLSLRPSRVSELLGMALTPEESAAALISLGFAVGSEGDAFKVGVPTWRADVIREIDLVEEVGRVLGYDRLPERLPSGATLQGGDSESGRFSICLRNALVGQGLQEVVCHSLVAPGPYEDPRDLDRRVGIRSALSAELSGLRRSLLPGLIDTLERNARRGNSPLAFFEIGNVFHVHGGAYQESQSIAAALCGSLEPVSWQKKQVRGPADYYSGRGVIESLWDGLHAGRPRFEPSDDPRLHPGRAARVLIGDRPVGYVGEIHPDLAAGLHVRDRVIVLALSTEPLRVAVRGQARFTPLSPYPGVVRDLAPRVRSELPYAQVEAAIERAEVGILESFDLTEVYSGSPLPTGMKSFTLSFTLRAPDHTLTETEVSEAIARLRASLETACGAVFAG